MKVHFGFTFVLITLFFASVFLGYLVSPTPNAYSVFYAPAITDTGDGALVKFSVSLIPGNGRTLVNIENVRYRQDTENALVKAKRNAEKITGVKLTYYDVVLDVNSIGSEVGGESAGAMFTAGIVSAFTGRMFDSRSTMSAGITENGMLFAVDGIEEKILAARNSGKSKFVVSKTQVVKNEDSITGIEIIRVVNVSEAINAVLS